MICKNCGADNDDAAKFCTECGAAFPRCCPQCDLLINGNDMFCPRCGKLVTELPKVKPEVIKTEPKTRKKTEAALPKQTTKKYIMRIIFFIIIAQFIFSFLSMVSMFVEKI